MTCREFAVICRSQPGEGSCCKPVNCLVAQSPSRPVSQSASQPSQAESVSCLRHRYNFEITFLPLALVAQMLHIKPQASAPLSSTQLDWRLRLARWQIIVLKKQFISLLSFVFCLPFRRARLANCLTVVAFSSVQALDQLSFSIYANCAYATVVRISYFIYLSACN